MASYDYSLITAMFYIVLALSGAFIGSLYTGQWKRSAQTPKWRHKLHLPWSLSASTNKSATMIIYMYCVWSAGVVQVVQFYYQTGILYRLRALGVRNDMDITLEGFHSWMFKGFSFLLPFLFIGYVSNDC